MGRVKEEWMRQLELETMYEWIDENYGDDAVESGDRPRFLINCGTPPILYIVCTVLVRL